MSLNRSLVSLRKLANVSTSRSRIALHRALLDLETTPDKWDEVYDSFDELLKVNRLADRETHLRFKMALTLLGSEVLESVGFWAATRAVEVPEVLREQVIQDMLVWSDGERRAFPSYQAVERWLRENYPELYQRTHRRNRIDYLRQALTEVTREKLALEERCRVIERTLAEARVILGGVS